MSDSWPRWSLATATAPAEEPVSVAEARQHIELVSSDTSHDDYLSALIAAAREHVETETGRQLVTASLRLKLDRFPVGRRPIWLPKPPAASVTSIGYTDTSGSAATVSGGDYSLLADDEPARVVPVYGLNWPSARLVEQAVTVTYQAGYGAATAVPQSIKQAILLMVGHWFEQREAAITGTIISEVPLAAQRLIANHKVGDWWTNYAGR